MQLCEGQGGDDAEGGEVDEEGQGLPLLPAQPGGLDEGVRLLDEGQGGVEVRGRLDESLDGLAEDRFDLRMLGRGDGGRKVSDCILLSITKPPQVERRKKILAKKSIPADNSKCLKECPLFSQCK